MLHCATFLTQTFSLLANLYTVTLICLDNANDAFFFARLTSVVFIMVTKSDVSYTNRLAFREHLLLEIYAKQQQAEQTRRPCTLLPLHFPTGVNLKFKFSHIASTTTYKGQRGVDTISSWLLSLSRYRFPYAFYHFFCFCFLFISVFFLYIHSYD